MLNTMNVDGTSEEKRLAAAGRRRSLCSKVAGVVVFFTWPLLLGTFLLGLPGGDDGGWSDLPSGSICNDGWRSTSRDGVGRTLKATPGTEPGAAGDRRRAARSCCPWSSSR